MKKMANTPSEMPQTPLFSERTLRLLKLSIVVMTLLIVAGLIALVIGMKQQADKLFDKQERQIQTYRYSFSEGSEYRAMHIGEEGAIWVEGRRSDGRIEAIELKKDGTPARHIILEQGDKLPE